MTRNKSQAIGSLLIGSVFVIAIFAALYTTVFAVSISSSVQVGNATPVVGSVTVNGGSAITLTASTTKNVDIGFTYSDGNGCGDVTTTTAPATTTIILYRSGISSSTCLTGSADNKNCYKIGVKSASTTCTIATTTNAVATTTISLWYFADGTDSSSSYSGQTWKATVKVVDAGNASGTGDSAGVVMNSLNAINIATNTLNYGLLAAGADTGAINQTAMVLNVGNTSTTVDLAASQTLISGSNFLATTSQHYASSSFTYGGTSEVALTGTLTALSGYSITTPTTTVDDGKNTFWGLKIDNGSASGTYSGTNIFSAHWVQ